MDAERLEEIDRELEAFGKSDDELAGVTARAVAIAADLGDADGELSDLMDGAEAALAAAREAARERALAVAREAAPMRERPSLPERPAPAPEAEITEADAEPAPEAEAEPVAEAEAEPAAEAEAEPVPEAEVAGVETPAQTELPPEEAAVAIEAAVDEAIFADDEPTGEDLTAEAAALDAAIDSAFGSEPPPTETSDIAGMSVDELFADADPTPSVPPDDLASLFDDEEPDSESLRLSDPDLGLASLEADDLEAASLPNPRAPSSPPPRAEAPPPPDRASSRPPSPQLEDFPMFGEEAEETQIVEPDEVELLSDDDFELLVDEDVLEMSGEDAEPPAEGGEGEGEDGEGGLISRILGRK